MVSGDHFHGDTGAAAIGHGLDDLASRWVEHALQTEEGESAFHVFVLKRILSRWRMDAGKGEDPQTLRGHRLDGSAYRFPIQRDAMAVGIESFVTAF